MPKERKRQKLEQEITCIVCPRNCTGFITVDYKGYECDKGVKYAVSELIAPQRVLTATILTRESRDKLLSVRTDKEVPKDKMLEMMQILRSKIIKAPIKIGDVIVPNILDTGANVVACTDLLK